MTLGRRYWTPAEKEAFRRLDPHSVYIVGPDWPVSGATHGGGANLRAAPLQAWGAYGGLFLVALGTNACPPWADRITAVWNKAPFWRMQLQGRFWVPSDVHAERLERALGTRLASLAAAPLPAPSWYGLAPSTTWAEVAATVRDVAVRAGMPWCRDDGEIAHECKRLAAAAAEGRAA